MFDVTGCGAGFGDPGALGEADNPARALVAGWRAGPFGGLVCPACQQRNGVMRRRRVPGHEPDDGDGALPAGARPAPCEAGSPPVRAMMAVFAVAAWPMLAAVTVQPGGLHRHGGPRVV